MQLSFDLHVPTPAAPKSTITNLPDGIGLVKTTVPLFINRWQGYKETKGYRVVSDQIGDIHIVVHRNLKYRKEERCETCGHCENPDHTREKKWIATVAETHSTLGKTRAEWNEEKDNTPLDAARETVGEISEWGIKKAQKRVTDIKTRHKRNLVNALPECVKDLEKLKNSDTPEAANGVLNYVESQVDKNRFQEILSYLRANTDAIPI